jgi:hypothetical protein
MPEEFNLTETHRCCFCESELSATARKCRFCGEWVARDCSRCGTPLRNEWAARGMCAECQKGALIALRGGQGLRTARDRLTAGVLALLLGGVGAHKFYLGKTGMGVLYLVFFWTFIPMLVSLVEGVVYLSSSDAAFEEKHGW